VMVLPDWRVSGPPLVGLERLSLRHTNRLCVEVDRPDHLDVPRAPGFEGAQIAAERLPAGGAFSVPLELPFGERKLDSVTVLCLSVTA
jgi:hypothetical protein